MLDLFSVILVTSCLYLPQVSRLSSLLEPRGGAGAVVKVEDCLPSIQEAVGLVCSAL